MPGRASAFPPRPAAPPARRNDHPGGPTIDTFFRKAVSRLRRTARPLGKRVERASLPRFAEVGPGLELQRPHSVTHPERIRLGHDVKLGPGSSLKCNTSFPGGWMKHPRGEHVTQEFDPSMEIGDRVTATASLQLAAFDSIVVEDDVMFAANVFACDGLHGTARGDVPYKYQGIERVAPIRFGRGAWIGQNVVVMPGVTIGAMAVVGANSVVTSDVPDGCVAVGVPARVVRRWNPAAGSWKAEAEADASREAAS